VTGSEDFPVAGGVAGVDEAGRGPVAGPVVAAAVVLPFGFDPEGITDSKKMTARAREAAFERILTVARVGIGVADADEIDRINILRATHEAMRRALAALPVAPEGVLVDGLPVPDLHERCEAVVRGDALHPCISAASVVAKVTRDALMAINDAAYPHYGFARHKGYGTRAHLAALAEHGPCPLHRRSFAPVLQLALIFEATVKETPR
jgi:ribonuclease HII